MWCNREGIIIIIVSFTYRMLQFAAVSFFFLSWFASDSHRQHRLIESINCGLCNGKNQLSALHELRWTACNSSTAPLAVIRRRTLLSIAKFSKPQSTTVYPVSGASVQTEMNKLQTLLWLWIIFFYYRIALRYTRNFRISMVLHTRPAKHMIYDLFPNSIYISMLLLFVFFLFFLRFRFR